MSKKRNADEQDSDSDTEIINVDFDFFDPMQPDYLALKRLLNQLFQGDAEELWIDELAGLIVAQPLVGTTVKLDGIDGDPYAFLTVLNLAVHKENPGIKALTNYILGKIPSTSSFHRTLQELLSSSDRHVGLIVSERLINIPVETVPPMYQMLSKEIQLAIDENEPFSFSHYLFISRTWRPHPSDMMDDDSTSVPPSKRMKVEGPSALDLSMQSFHPEDTEVMQRLGLQHAIHVLDYEFSNKSTQVNAALSRDIGGRVMLMSSESFPLLVQALSKAYPVP
ncbi:hypothetical protein Clacol_003614 [Clathrus columnatus]|uniref:Protein BCP1 n=1 Tax=Clathrus columnatus TaxID=1419009 RepID=A0AAV5A476_9AGAM|nr:hypothetical protein Clacol_003614 [Clathrus columnatus]